MIFFFWFCSTSVRLIDLLYLLFIIFYFISFEVPNQEDHLSLHRTTMAEIHDQFDTILILDFGSQVRYIVVTKNLTDLSVSSFSTAT